jgi:hypothetical protein
MRRLLLIPILSLIIPLYVSADDQPQHVSLTKLVKTPLAAGALKIRVAKLSRSSVLGHGRGHIEVEVGNTAASPETFYPQRLTLVNRDNIQVNVVAPRRSYYYRAAPPYDPRMPATLLEIRITPGARIKEVYSLSGKIQLPARLFYDDKLLAEIVE